MKPIIVKRWGNGLGVDIQFTREVSMNKHNSVSLQNEQLVELVKALQSPLKGTPFEDAIGLDGDKTNALGLIGLMVNE